MKTPISAGNALRTGPTLFTLFRNVKRQKKFLASELGHALLLASEENDGSLDKEDFQKITKYYGLAVPAILGEALCALRDKPMSLRERKALTYQGAMTGLFDDFFDKEKLTEEEVMRFMNNPEDIKAKNARQRLFLQFYEKARENSQEPEQMLGWLGNVYAAQVMSKQQGKRGQLSVDELKKITVEKGGVSVLFYRSSLSNPLQKKEEQALYLVGGLMQFGNDIFDVYKDCLHQIDTLITVAKRVNDVRDEFSQMMERSFESVLGTDYSRKNCRKFLRLISMSLCSRCFVCLDQLEKLEIRSQQVFDPCRFGREDLVCDMEKGLNKWRTVGYFLRNRIR